jgi:radical SAM superfamily enzyme YgiQ (UPF0313 family)
LTEIMRKALLIDLFALPEYDISLALGYLKAYADADPEIRGAWQIDLLHLPVGTPADAVVAAVAKAAPDLAGFSCYSWNIRDVERAVGRLPEDGRPIVVLGGIEVTPDPSGYLRKNRNADLVVFGEGEITFRDVLAALKDPASRPGAATLGSVQGVCWRDGKAVKRNAGRPPIPDLSTIPSPYLSGSYGALLKDQDRVMVETARGCPYTCTFCFEPRGFAKVRSFPVDRVKQELRSIVGAGVREVAFLDTNFNMDRKRAVDLWGFLADLGGRVRYAFELRGELIDAEQSRALSRLDYFAEIGLQSIHKRSLDAVKRWYEPERFSNGVRGLLEAGIYRPCSHSAHGGVAVDLMMGLPTETVADAMESFDFVFSVAPSSMALTMTKILPGTELYDDAKKFRYAFDEDAQYEMTSSATVTRDDARALLRFRDAVEFAYNRLHAVRTIGWLSDRLGLRPSKVFSLLGDRMAADGRPPATLTVKDLEEHLAALAAERGDARLAEEFRDKFAAENMLNALQRKREAKRNWWSRLLFKAGHGFLTRFGGLPPLPAPRSAPAPTSGTPAPAAVA